MVAQSFHLAESWSTYSGGTSSGSMHSCVPGRRASSSSRYWIEVGPACGSMSASAVALSFDSMRARSAFERRWGRLSCRPGSVVIFVATAVKARAELDMRTRSRLGWFSSILRIAGEEMEDWDRRSMTRRCCGSVRCKARVRSASVACGSQRGPRTVLDGFRERVRRCLMPLMAAGHQVFDTRMTMSRSRYVR
jgi:hypothetical protein